MDNSKDLKSVAATYSLPPVLIASFLFIICPSAMAGTTFGIYDARTLAMGGTSVASANNDNAQFYNSALLAFNEEIEERTQDSRFFIPILVPQIAESAITFEELTQESPRQAITRAVRSFNATPDPQTAQAVVDATASIDASLAALSGEDLFGDIYIGFAGSEPGKHRGTGFFMGARLLAGGRTTVTPEDRELLAAYQEGLTFVASGGQQGTARPDLFDVNGALIDPGNDFNSTANAAGAVIAEAGVPISRQMQLFGQQIAAGFTFKVQIIDTFEDAERVVDDRIDVEQNSEHHGNINFDIGLVKEIGDRWRVGFAIKDVIPHNYDTSLGTAIRLRPRARIGAAYQIGRLQIASDIDVTQNEPLGSEKPTQEAAVGAEWVFEFPVKVRAGYRQDFKGNRDGVASVGIGTLWKRFALDFAYAAGSDTKAGALQFGVAF